MKARTVGIWASGILAGAIFGALLGNHLHPDDTRHGLIFGALGGVLCFTCLRLWVAGNS
jgi:hypothetical protein